mmetsp:Transcript_7197/g.17559  ORF Transcript_7197/g.17559 Transcript_7197/m.17559 type:complete len:179 (+) Transcript_7197:13-549(+)
MNPPCTNAILSEAGMLVENDKATLQMQKSISKFASLLVCPLCQKVFDRPATLSACGHTFCVSCIDEYSSKNSECPVEGCGMPISIVGSNGGSFRKINLQISQAVESLQLICKSLNLCEKNWWSSHTTLQSINEAKSLKVREPNSYVQADLPIGGWRITDHNHEEYDDDELIDLQADGS